MGSQELSKPVMVSILTVAVVIIGLAGWYFFMRPQQYPGFQAPPPGQGAPGMVPGAAPAPGQPMGGPR